MVRDTTRRCRRCRKRLTFAPTHECPKCGYWDRQWYLADHTHRNIAKHYTIGQIIAEYREGGWSPPAELVARVQGREAAA